MEEQILEILKKRMIYPDLQDRLKMTLTLMSEDITSHVIEFIEWLGNNSEPRVNNYWDVLNDDYKTYTKMPLDEVYQYWLNNVKHA